MVHAVPHYSGCYVTTLLGPTYRRMKRSTAGIICGWLRNSCNNGYTYFKFAFTASARLSFIFGAAESSSREAFRIASIEPKWLNNALRRAGPIPGMASSCEASPNLERRFRCAVIAKRCASSRTRCTKYNPSDFLGKRTERALPGRNISSSRLANPATGTRSIKPNSSSTLMARLSCPLPPSTINRSGKDANDRSGFLPGVSAVS